MIDEVTEVSENASAFPSKRTAISLNHEGRAREGKRVEMENH